MKMKQLLCSMGVIALTSLTAMAQNANAILGIYLTEKKNAKVQIVKEGNSLVGRLIWTITPGAVDKSNPVESERTKPLVGKLILKGFAYSGDNLWEGGTIYDPESGKTYKCKITRQEDGTLKVRGFIGVSLIGRNSYWTPIKE